MEVETILFILLIGFLAGIIGGMLGVGGGILIIPALIFVLAFPVHLAQGTMLAMMIPPIGISAFYSYRKKKMINYKAAFLLMFTFVIGTYYGSKITLLLPEEVMKPAFGVLVVLFGVKMLLQKKKVILKTEK